MGQVPARRLSAGTTPAGRVEVCLSRQADSDRLTAGRPPRSAGLIGMRDCLADRRAPSPDAQQIAVHNNQAMTNPPERPYRRLTLSVNNKMLAGVCGGI